MTARPVGKSVGRLWLFRLGCAIAAPALALILLEGSISLAAAGWKLLHRRPVAERSHTRYDPELGWVNVPGLKLADLYRPGASVTIDADGFRTSPREPSPPDAGSPVATWACSGDSFTFGYGVDDAETWCALLEGRFRGVTTRNLGLGGYGLDQVVLAWRREADRVRPRVHLLALDVHMFPRLARLDLHGYGKPRALLVDGSLRFENLPVPRGPIANSFWTDLLDALSDLRLVSILRPRPGATLATVDVAALSPLAASLVEEVARLDRAVGARLVVVFLPVLGDASGATSDPWRVEAAAWARAAGADFVDLVPALERLPPGEAAKLYILEGEMAFTGAAGHPNAAGHRFVAGELMQGLGERQVLQAVAERRASSSVAEPELSDGGPARSTEGGVW